MIELLVVFVQIALVGTITLVASRATLTRDPAVAARLSLAGIVVCGSILPLNLLQVPRLWSLTDLESLVQVSDESAYGNSRENIAIGKASGHTLGTETKNNSDLLKFDPLHFVTGVSAASLANPAMQSQVRDVVTCAAIVVGVGILVRILLGCLGLWKIGRSSQSCADRTLLFEFNALVSKVRLSRESELRIGGSVQAPCVSWLHPGKVFVPAEFAQWTKPERLAAVSHELIHLERRDAGWRMLADVWIMAMSFHPIAYLLRSNLVLTQELATDSRAIRMLENTSDYRTGLSLLALRMDAQRSQRLSMGVSVSTNSLVRRIKMLSKPFSPIGRLHSAVLFGAFLSLCLAMTSWSARADDPIRIASRENVKELFKPFERDYCKPWDDLGTQRGYWSLRVDAFKNGIWSQLWTSAASNIQGIDLNDHGLDHGNVETLITDLQVDLTYLEPEKRKDPDKKFEGTISSKAFSVRTKSPVEWAKLGGLILEQNDFPDEVTTFLREAFQEYGTSSQFQLISEQSQEVEVELDEEIKATFDIVNGGVLTMASVVPTESLNQVIPHLRSKDDPFQLGRLLQMTQVVAFGLDQQPGTDTLAIRLALLPNPDVASNDLIQMIRSKLVTTDLVLAAVGGNSRLSADSVGRALSGANVYEKQSLELDRPCIVIDLQYTGDIAKLLGVQQETANVVSEGTESVNR